MSHERIRVLVETTERTLRGTVHKPVGDDRYRLSDYLNTYDRTFLCLTDVQINERGQEYRAGEHADFIAVAVNAITYIRPIDDK
jgi:hypothetical protein